MRTLLLLAVLALTVATLPDIAVGGDDTTSSLPEGKATTPTTRAAPTRAAAPTTAPAPTAALRHSGTVVRVAPDPGTLTIAETVAWTGPGTGVVERTITVSDGTDVRLVVRDESSMTRANVPGYREMPFRFSDLAPGDFVTVTTPPDRTAAVAIDVWRPSSEAEGAASPGSVDAPRELPPREGGSGQR